VKEMNVLLLGGSGRVGKAAAIDLVKSDAVSKVTLGDINLKEAKRYSERVGSDKLKVEYVDLRDFRGLVKKMEGHDVIANAAWFDSIPDVTRAAIEAKRNCCDVGGFYYHSLEQLKLDEFAKKAGVTILMGMGSSPGVTNICVSYGANKLDSLEEIHLSASGAIPKPGTKVKGRTMTIRTGFEELTDNPMVYQNGKMVFVAPRSGEEKVKFPEPIGERIVYFARHSELATLPGFKGAKTVDFKIYQSPENLKMANLLDEVGVTSTEPIKVGDIEIEPRKVLLQCLYTGPTEKNEPEGIDITANHIVLIGQKNGKHVQYTYDLIGERELKWGNQKTGIPMSIGCQMLGKGEIKEKGVVPPEVCVDPEKFFAELRKRGGMNLTEEIKRCRDL
jgi:saccharopine dehydrogenase-like NADP-dependent oxidoreductase